MAILTQQPSTRELLARAGRHIFSLGMGDGSARLGEGNAIYGTAKVMAALDGKGIDSSRTLAIFTPDGGITRNKERWQAGFGYGCYFRWPSPEEAGTALAFPQVKPNACGVLVVRIGEEPAPEDLIHRMTRLREKGLRLEGTSVKFNLGVSNHFVEVCRIEESRLPHLPTGSLVAAMHNSPSEFRDELYDFDLWERRGGHWVNTPLGRIFVLEGAPALRYFDIYREIDAFGKHKRLSLAKELFGEVEQICNPTHQGLFGPNLVRLGVYDTTDADTAPSGEPLFPLTLRWDLPNYLIRGKTNVSRDRIRDQALLKRADDLGLADLLERADMLPHGGGYAIPFRVDHWRATTEDGSRLFHVHSNGTQYIFSSPSELPYSYRGEEVLAKIDQLGLGEVVGRLRQLYTLKH